MVKTPFPPEKIVSYRTEEGGQGRRGGAHEKTGQKGGRKRESWREMLLGGGKKEWG